MLQSPHIKALPKRVREHLANVAENLQLVADMGYGDVALAVPAADGTLEVVADARPATAIAPFASSRVGSRLPSEEEPEAYDAMRRGESVLGDRRRVTRGISYITAAYPVGPQEAFAVVLRDLAEQVVDEPGAMERAFIDIAEELLDSLKASPLEDVRDGSPFSTTRTAGDGVMRVSASGVISYEPECGQHPEARRS